MISRRDRRDKSELEISVDSLRDEVRVLRDVLDEIREALEWQNNNAAVFPSLVEHRLATWPRTEASLPAAEPADDSHETATSASKDANTPAGKQRNFF